MKIQPPPDALDDYSFLLELIRLVDADPDVFVCASDVARSLGLGGAETEPTVRRLMNRGLIAWAPGPRRLGDGWDGDLAVTAEGYRHDGTGLRQ